MSDIMVISLIFVMPLLHLLFTFCVNDIKNIHSDLSPRTIVSVVTTITSVLMSINGLAAKTPTMKNDINL